MGWKPKEKPLTHEEALALAIRELAPYWLGTGPLLAGVRGADGKATAHPLDQSFDKRAWLLLFIDPTDFRAEALMAHAREWARRYGTHDVGMLLVARATYSFLRSAAALQVFLRKPSEAFPIALDHDGLIAEAFVGSPPTYPTVRLMHKRKTIFDRSGAAWANGSERELQKFLRLTDPGLPLPMPFGVAETLPKDTGAAEFGAQERSPSSTIFKVTGKVAREADHISIHDPTTTVRFQSPSAQVALIAKSALSTHEPTRIRLELNGDTVFEATAGTDLFFGDDGGSSLKVNEGRLYHLLRNLPAHAREITLRFPDAERLPIALYGVRFADIDVK